MLVLVDWVRHITNNLNISQQSTVISQQSTVNLLSSRSGLSEDEAYDLIKLLHMGMKNKLVAIPVPDLKEKDLQKLIDPETMINSSNEKGE